MTVRNGRAFTDDEPGLGCLLQFGLKFFRLDVPQGFSKKQHRHALRGLYRVSKEHSRIRHFVDQRICEGEIYLAGKIIHTQ